MIIQTLTIHFQLIPTNFKHLAGPIYFQCILRALNLRPHFKTITLILFIHTVRLSAQQHARTNDSMLTEQE